MAGMKVFAKTSHENSIGADTFRLKQYFRLTTEFKNFMFEHLNIHGSTGIFAACIVMFFVTILLEALKAVVVYIHLRLTQNPLTYGRTNISINHDRKSLFDFLLVALTVLVTVGVSLGKTLQSLTLTLIQTRECEGELESYCKGYALRNQRLKLHFAGFFTHTINVILGYLIMLAVMTYDAYIFFAVILGTGLGYYIFGAITVQNQIVYAALKNSVYERYDSQAALNNEQSDT